MQLLLSAPRPLDLLLLSRSREIVSPPLRLATDERRSPQVWSRSDFPLARSHSRRFTLEIEPEVPAPHVVLVSVIQESAKGPAEAVESRDGGETGVHLKHDHLVSRGTVSEDMHGKISV